MAIAPLKILEVSEGDDPKDVVMKALAGVFDDWTVYRNEVIVATAPAATKTKGGIIVPDSRKAETRFQGTVGLILKLGENAFDDPKLWPDGKSRPRVGDWVHYRASNTDEFAINDISCRYVRDDMIRARVPGPEGVR